METTVTVPDMPLEVITLILQQITGDDGILMLWLVCRHVSKTWRLLVEHVFIVRELPVTSIMLLIPGDSKDYDGDPCDWEDLYSSHQFRIYTYDRLQDESKKTAVFTMETLECRQKRHYQDYLSSLRDCPRILSTADRTYPQHIVRSRRFANDTEIPSCRPEGNSRTQLYCDWRSLLTNLLTEESRIQRRTLANVSKHDLRRAYDLSWLIEKDMMSDQSVLQSEVSNGLDCIQDCRDVSQRAERRLRIAAQQDRDYPEDRTIETRSALERVLRERVELLYIEFDDDEVALVESRDESMYDNNDDWVCYESSKIHHWWLNEAMDIAAEKMEHADREWKFTRLAKKMKQQKLWWRGAEDSEDSNHLVDEKQVDHKYEREEDALPEMTSTSAVEVKQSIERSEVLEALS
ncbi:hypothetical protein MMC17_004294 [Xylographa soralifera]|nr:hypothetical protein [Xylographa soralifera]